MVFIRRVQATLREVVTPDYQEWLTHHAAELLLLQNADGDALIARILSRKSEDGLMFATDFEFNTQEDLEFYTKNYLDEARQKLKESYPDVGTPSARITYKFSILPAQPSDAERQAFDALLLTDRKMTQFLCEENSAHKTHQHSPRS